MEICYLLFARTFLYCNICTSYFRNHCPAIILLIDKERDDIVLIRNSSQFSCHNTVDLSDCCKGNLFFHPLQRLKISRLNLLSQSNKCFMKENQGKRKYKDCLCTC